MMKNFDVLNIELEGSKLIEASAGTGKTYSLAILALRLVMEKGIPLGDILMVTFTNAATAELEVRVREFVRAAYKHARGDVKNDIIIGRAVDNAIKLADNDTVASRLNDSLKKLDDTSVMTIHSFCHNTLSELQFETGQADELEIISDLSDIIEYEVNEFWRKEVSTIDPAILGGLAGFMDKSKISLAISKVMGNREFSFIRKDKEQAGEEVSQKWEAFQQAEQAFNDHCENNFADIISRAQSNGYARKFVADCSDDCNAFMGKFLEKDGSPKYFQTVFPVENELAKKIGECKEDLEIAAVIFRDILINEAVQTAIPGVHRRLRYLNAISYDELISGLHSAVMKNLDKLKGPLAEKYKAVFIDEFQDTDKLQYEIFDRIFDGESVIFYIGDPKQSIYAWRNADLATYIRARAKIGSESCYSMDINYRSTPGMVQSLNKFFKPNDNFDAFSSEDIIYREVRSAKNPNKLFSGMAAAVPLSISESGKKDLITASLAEDILSLLSDEAYTIGENAPGRRVVPSDIAVLVRTSKEGKEIKAALSEKGIPAVTVDDTRVLDSGEALLIVKLMKALIHPDKKSLNSLLADDLFAFRLDEILRINDEKVLEVLSALKETWLSSGVYNMMSEFLQEFSIVGRCLSRQSTEGQRSITNLYQLMEIIHDTEIKKQFNIDDLLAWLEKASADENNKREEYEQRIESDERAVQIMTIHKCKGLTFNIVFAPFLDFHKHDVENGINYQDEKDNNFFTYNPVEDDRALYDKQLDQENKRLIYVALTRAVYKTFVYSNTYYNGKTELKDYLIYHSDEEKKGLKGIIEFDPVAKEVEEIYYRDAGDEIAQARPVDSIPVIKSAWGIHSFSSLSSKHEFVSADIIDIHDDYDNFVFNEMPKGVKAGLFLHSLFERLDFTNPDGYSEALKRSGSLYPSVYREEHAGNYLKLVHHCMGVKIGDNGKGGFSLNEIADERKLPELEFYFSIDSHRLSRVSSIIPGIEFTNDHEIEGLVRGFIDLFFEHGGKYYLLDWKSNFLGNTLQDYSRAGLETGMRANNYHLQYYLYTIAARRYLKQKLPGFDYQRDFGGIIYMFLRGVRSDDSGTGIFFDKPEVEKVEALEGVFGG